MLPEYEARHKRQITGFEGLDLAVEWQRQILSCAQDIARSSILQLDHLQFHVASQSRPGLYYEVDLQRSTCNCDDFPRIRFCKHIAVIYSYFPDLLPPQDTPSHMAPGAREQLSQPRCTDRPSDPNESL